MIVQPMLHTPQILAESGYTGAFTDASASLPDRSATLLRVAGFKATSLAIRLIR